MKRRDLLNEIKAIAKYKGAAFKFDASQGKGSHGTIYFNDKKTTCPKEVGPVLAKHIKKQLGIE
jgi:hypothetical protein